MSTGSDGNPGEALVVRDAFEDASPSVPDTPEIAAAAERAGQLRAAHLAVLEADQPANERIEAFRAQAAAEAELDLLKVGVQSNTERAEEARAKAAELEAKAVQAEAAGRAHEAAEYREDAAQDLALARASDARVEQFRAEAQAVQQRVDELDQQVQTLEAREAAADTELDAVERAVDALEEQVDLMRQANQQQALASALTDEAAQLRSEGRIEEAEEREARATQALAAASTAQSQAEAKVVDEQALTVLEQPSPRVDDLVDDTAPDIDAEFETGSLGTDAVGDASSVPAADPDDDGADIEVFRTPADAEFEPVEIEFDSSTPEDAIPTGGTGVGDGGYEALSDVAPVEEMESINQVAPVDDAGSVDDVGMDETEMA
jgi:hypothetical protein